MLQKHTLNINKIMPGLRVFFLLSFLSTILPSYLMGLHVFLEVGHMFEADLTGLADFLHKHSIINSIFNGPPKKKHHLSTKVALHRLSAPGYII